jgi:hypothetical protein
MARLSSVKRPTATPARRSSAPEMRQHAVHPVEIFPHVLEEQDRPVEIGKVSSPDETLEQREVAARERPLGHTTAQRRDAILAGQQHSGRLRQALQPAGRRGGDQDPLEMAAGEGRHRGPRHRGVERHHPGAPGDGVEDGGDVRIADERLRRLGERVEIHPIENPRRPIAAPDAPDRGCVGIAEGAVQIGQPLIVGAREVAVPLRGVGAQCRFVTQRTAERFGPG